MSRKLRKLEGEIAEAFIEGAALSAYRTYQHTRRGVDLLLKSGEINAAKHRAVIEEIMGILRVASQATANQLIQFMGTETPLKDLGQSEKYWEKTGVIEPVTDAPA